MKHVIIISVLILLAFACDDNSTDKLPDSNSLIGDWEFVDSKYQVEVTTNSDQAISHPDSEGIGEIKIQGELDVTLKYMYVGGFNGEIVYITDCYLSDSTQSPSYKIEMINLGSNKWYLSFRIISSENKKTFSVNLNAAAEFEKSTFTLHIDSTFCYEFDSNTNSYDSSKFVVISGSLQNRITVIPSETPTTVDMETNVGGWLSGYELVFEEDSTWTGHIGEDTINGEFYTIDDQLFIVEERPPFAVFSIDTTQYQYSIEDNILTLINYDECSNDGYSLWCLGSPDFIGFFEDGSLESYRHIKIRQFLKK